MSSIGDLEEVGGVCIGESGGEVDIGIGDDIGGFGVNDSREEDFPVEVDTDGVEADDEVCLHVAGGAGVCDGLAEGMGGEYC